MIVRDGSTTYEIVRLHGHDYILTEDGRAIPMIAGGAIFGVDTAVLVVLAITIAAAAASAYATYQMGQQQKKAAKANSKMMERRAEMEKQAAAGKAADIREQNRRMLATQAAAGSASGLSMEAGTSPLAAMAYSAREGELDALRAEWSGDANAEASYANSRMARFEGRVAEYGANLQAGSTLLSGASSAARTYRTA